jgi:hypothetical protein
MLSPIRACKRGFLVTVNVLKAISKMGRLISSSRLCRMLRGKHWELGIVS